MKKPCIRKLLLILLVINFIALVIALTNLITPNPLKEYRLILAISFMVIAYFARQCCKGEKEKSNN